jgi:hypothetical protein
MRPMFFLSLLVIVGCGEPPEICETIDVGNGQLECETIDVCCTDEAVPQCAYVTQRDERYECDDGADCSAAATDVVCDVCDIDPAIADDVGCG